VIQAANALYEESIELNNAALEGESLIVPCADEEDEAEASPSWASRLPSLLQAWRTLSTDVNRFTAAMQVLESAWSGKASTKEDPAEEAAMALQSPKSPRSGRS
jgi:hypothetical protein